MSEEDVVSAGSLHHPLQGHREEGPHQDGHGQAGGHDYPPHHNSLLILASEPVLRIQSRPETYRYCFLAQNKSFRSKLLTNHKTLELRNLFSRIWCSKVFKKGHLRFQIRLIRICKTTIASFQYLFSKDVSGSYELGCPTKVSNS